MISDAMLYCLRLILSKLCEFSWLSICKIVYLNVLNVYSEKEFSVRKQLTASNAIQPNSLHIIKNFQLCSFVILIRFQVKFQTKISISNLSHFNLDQFNESCTFSLYHSQLIFIAFLITVQLDHQIVRAVALILLAWNVCTVGLNVLLKGEFHS